MSIKSMKEMAVLLAESKYDKIPTLWCHYWCVLIKNVKKYQFFWKFKGSDLRSQKWQNFSYPQHHAENEYPDAMHIWPNLLKNPDLKGRIRMFNQFIVLHYINLCINCPLTKEYRYICSNYFAEMLLACSRCFPSNHQNRDPGKGHNKTLQFEVQFKEIFGIRQQ